MENKVYDVGCGRKILKETPRVNGAVSWVVDCAVQCLFFLLIWITLKMEIYLNSEGQLCLGLEDNGGVVISYGKVTVWNTAWPGL